MTNVPDAAWTGRAEDALLVHVEGYWRALRGRHRLPRRAALDPGRIAAAVPYCFMAAKIAPRVARIRVAGRGIGAILDTEPRGLPVTACFRGSARDIVADTLEQVFAGPGIAALPLAAHRVGRRPATGRMLLLPMIGDDGLVSVCLGVIAGPGLAAAGRRLEIGAGVRRCERVTRDGAGPRLAARGAAAALPGRGLAALRLVVDNG